jgi:hypothetical protein
MQSRNWIPVMPLASLFVLQATASCGQEAIGKATSVRPQNTRTLAGGSDVYSKETVRVRIRTGDTGHANLHHNDINLSVGPQSSVHLEKNVYDFGVKSADTIAVQAERGSLRFATASQGGGSSQIKTPYGTLGVTSFEDVANPTEPRNSRQAPQISSKTSPKFEKAIAAKKESARHRANTTTATKIATVKPKMVATAAKPTTAKPRSETEPVEEKANSRTITEPEITSSTQPLATPDPVPKKETTAIGGKAESQATGQPSETSDPVPKKEPTTIAGRTEGPASDQPSETSDPVLKKAKIAVAAKMEDPTSAEFVDMKRVMRKNSFGEPFEVICGRVKGKKKLDNSTGERPFIYLVNGDDAYILVNGNPDSLAALVYRAHCISANSR